VDFLNTGSGPDTRHLVYSRLATSADTSLSTYTWTHPSFWRMGVLNAFSGTSLIIDVVGTGATGNSTTPTATGVTTTADNAMLVGTVATNSSGGLAAGTSGLTESGDVIQMAMYYGTQAAQGASGNKAFAANTGHWTAHLLAIKEDTGAPAAAAIRRWTMGTMGVQ
jgi:hypothetical protein